MVLYGEYVEWRIGGLHDTQHGSREDSTFPSIIYNRSSNPSFDHSSTLGVVRKKETRCSCAPDRFVATIVVDVDFIGEICDTAQTKKTMLYMHQIGDIL